MACSSPLPIAPSTNRVRKKNSSCQPPAKPGPAAPSAASALKAGKSLKAWTSAVPGERNDPGEWNGQNHLGIDRGAVLLAQHNQADKFSLREFVHIQAQLCRVFVRHTGFPYVKRYAALIRANPLAEKEGVAGYELALTFNGVPFDLTPRAASEIKSKSRFQLLSVNEAEEHKDPCRRLLLKRGNHWE